MWYLWGVLIVATPGAVSLSLTVGDGNTGVFPRARVYNEANALIDTVDMAHLALGRYVGSTTVTSGQFTVHYLVYTDVARTTVSQYYQADQDVIVTDSAENVWEVARSGSGAAGTFGEAMKLMLGSIGKANYRIDNMVYDANSFMTSCRLRVFPDQATASASTPGGVAEGELYEITVTGVADGTFPQLPSTVLGLF